MKSLNLPHKISSILHFTFYILLIACANPGSGPDGGPYDETPPRVVGMTAPENAGTGGKKGTKITIKFSEAVQVENAQEKVVVSPPQLTPPEISASGKRVKVELLDTLQENVTYTIDFSDAIKDATEGNPLGFFTYVFSTGGEPDSLEVSGKVLAADNLEPQKGMLVGLYPADAPDSAFRTEPMKRVARTNDFGEYCIKGVAPGEYKLVCLQDLDQDYRFSMKGEMIGWARKTVIPSIEIRSRQDTLWKKPGVEIDTIQTVDYTCFLPDDADLLCFKEANQPRHRLKENREDLNRLKFFFTAPSKERPSLRGLNFDDSCLKLEHSPGYDTLTYWICDTTFVNTDSLQFTLTYEATDDSTGLAILQTDTLELTPRVPLERRMKLKAAEDAKWQKALERRHKRGDYSQEEPPPVMVALEGRPNSRISPTSQVTMRFSEPIDTIRRSGIRLMLGPDSAQVEAPYELEQIPHLLRTYELRAEWRPGQHYTLQIDSASVTSVYGHNIAKETCQISVQKLEEYGTVFITIPDADSTTVVQLLDAGGRVVRHQRVIPLGKAQEGSSITGGRAEFYYVAPGSYYYNCFFDHNEDGRWTPGDYDLQRQAEEVYYSPVLLDVKANFDFDQTWRLADLPLSKQKPEALIKQKGQKNTKMGGHEKNEQRKLNKANKK